MVVYNSRIYEKHLREKMKKEEHEAHPLFPPNLAVGDLVEAKRRFRGNMKALGMKSDKTIDRIIAHLEKEGGLPSEIIARLHNGLRNYHNNKKAAGEIGGFLGGGVLGNAMVEASRALYGAVRKKTTELFIPLVGPLTSEQTSELEKRLQIQPSRGDDVIGVAAIAFFIVLALLALLPRR
jgi:hypothetical protein